MKTSKPFATISYNTHDFLVRRLDELVSKRLIQFYTFVFHFAEDFGEKDHIHLIVFPNGLFQTDDLRDFLTEVDSSNPVAPPLGCMPCVSAKWADWYLYSCHDSAYLASKGLERKHHYTESDFTRSDETFFNEMVHTIDRTKYVKSMEFVQKVVDGVSLKKLVSTGQVPVNQFVQYSALYSYLRDGVDDSHSSCKKVDVEVFDL